MRGSIACAVLAALGACKEKQETPAPAVKPPAPPQPAAPKPCLPEETPAPAEAKPGKPISVDEAKTALPPLGGREIIELKQTSDGHQVHGTWCIDGTSADDVAKQIGRSLAQVKY